MNKSQLWADSEWCAAHWGNRRGRPWSEAEYNKALTMRFYKRSAAEIARELGRTVVSVERKIGYQPRRKHEATL